MKLAVLCSLLFSILHSVLFYGQKWGISIFLFILVGLFFFILVLQKKEKIKNRKALFLSVPILIISSTYFIFNNAFFNFFNMVAILLLFAIMAISTLAGEFKIGQLIQNLFILYFGPIEEMGESAREISHCFSEKPQNENKKNKLGNKILKGVLCSLPILILVIILLVSADEMFASIFNNIFKNLIRFVNLKTIYSFLFRILLIVVLTLYFIGIFIKIKNNQLKDEEIKSKNKLKIEVVTLNTLLTLLNIVYLIFSAMQGIYLIKQIGGGSNLNYAHYARTGFFQLMAVSIINFVVLFLCKNNKKETSNIAKKYVKVMNVLLALFTIIILVSSVIRMHLYEKEYGYTFLRIMVYFIQITELILILPTIVYIIKEKFPILKWYMAITICMYIIINFANIDFIIAKGNIDRYFSATDEEKQKIDFSYLKTKTGTDALPEIARLLETDDNLLKAKVNNYLLEKYEDLKKEKGSFQEFNISKERAKKELEKLNLSYIGANKEYDLEYRPNKRI